MQSPKPPPGHFSVLYFASATTVTKKSAEFFKAPLPISELFGLLESSYPGIKDGVLLSSAVTVNLEYVDVERDDHSDRSSSDLNRMLTEGDEVAIIPPVSSG